MSKYVFTIKADPIKGCVVNTWADVSPLVGMNGVDDIDKLADVIERLDPEDKTRAHLKALVSYLQKYAGAFGDMWKRMHPELVGPLMVDWDDSEEKDPLTPEAVESYVNALDPVSRAEFFKKARF
jgi:hypothetical protein